MRPINDSNRLNTGTNVRQRIGQRPLEKALGVLLALWFAAMPLVAQEDVGRVIEFESLRLRAENPFTRAQASDTIRRLASGKSASPGLRETLRSLIHLLEDPRPIVRWNIAVAVIRIGDMPETENAYRVLENDARADSYSAAIGAVETLADLRTDRSREILSAVAESQPDEDVRDAARIALAPRNEGIGGGGGFNFVPDDDGNADANERELSSAERLAKAQFAVDNLPASAALSTLAELTRYREGFAVENERTTWDELVAPEALALMRFLRQENPPPPMDVRNAARILGVGGDAVIPTLIAALEDPLPRVREAAAFALITAATTPEGKAADPIPPDAPGAVVFSLSDESATVRRYAAVFIGGVGATEYRRDLAIALGDADARVRAAAARALIELGESPERTRAVETLRADLKSAPPPQKRYALEALATTMPTDELRAFVRSDAPELAYAAASLLAKRDDAELWRLVGDAGSDEREWVKEAIRLAVAGRFVTDNPWMAAFVGLNALEPTETPASASARVVAGGGWECFSDVAVEMPVPNAALRVNGDAERLIRADALGRFELPARADESYDIHVEAEGFIPLDVYRSAAERNEPLVLRLHRD